MAEGRFHFTADSYREVVRIVFHVRPFQALTFLDVRPELDVVGKPEHGQDGFFELGRPPEEFAIAEPTGIMPVKPEPGLMILFPSYFYHRTIPFVSDQRRISIAFDVMPRG